MKPLTIFLFIAAANAVNVPGQLFCFTCSYTDQKRCIVANNLPTVNCQTLSSQDILDGYKNQCFKTINPNGKYNKKYDRGCKRVDPDGDFCDEFTTNNKDSKCYVCDHELCNGANGKQISKGLIVFVVSLAMMMNFAAQK